jgi:hypothetical protein
MHSPSIKLFKETIAIYCENHTEHRNTVRTSQETHYVSATQTNRLMLFRETVAVYWENHTEHRNTVRTSQETHYVSATQTYRLMLFRETVTVYWSWCWSSSCGRRSVDQFVLGIEPPLGTHDQTFSSFFSVDSYVLLVPLAPSLTRGRVCSLQCSHSLLRLLMPNNHTLPSHLRLFLFCRLLRLAGTAVEVF